MIRITNFFITLFACCVVTNGLTAGNGDDYRKKAVMQGQELVKQRKIPTAGSLEEYRKKQMILDLEVIKHHFEVAYAPLDWKKEQVGFDLDLAFETAKAQILETPAITTKQFQMIVKHFIRATKDYHVDVHFYSTEAASLPFTIRGAEGRYFIDWIDPLRLPSSHFSVKVGDELLQFDERLIGEAVKDLIAEAGKKSNERTDQRTAEIKLTQRTGMAGDHVPKGSIMISTRSKASGKVDTCQLHWSYTPEHISSPLDFLESLDFFSSISWDVKEAPRLEIPRVSMANPLHEDEARHSADRLGGVGSKKSFVPVLGETIWEIENEPKEEGSSLAYWNAYIYRHASGKAIGYIRIPHYDESRSLIKEFGEIINHMDQHTDALVIDQLHNFGGYVDYMYGLASILAVEPLQAPYHRIKITQKEALVAYSKLEMIKLIELVLLNKESEDEQTDDKNRDGDDEKNDEHQDKAPKSNENPINFQELMFLKSYYQLILEDWNRGVTLTRPTPILGVDRINPHAKYHYTKPIVMLIDEMDFSGGDFMPAILQDNRRALLFGSRTAGAGGFVFSFQFPNNHGIGKCSYTGSIAERSGTAKIENVGVTPDIQYHLTPSDIQNGYQGYVNAVNQAVLQCLNQKK